MAKIFLTLLSAVYSFGVYAAPTTFVHGANLKTDLFDFRGYFDWKLIEDHLQATKQNDTTVDYYTLDRVRNLYLSQGFELYEETEGLYQTRKSVLKSIGSLIPSLRFSFSPGSYTSTFSGLFTGLLGFLLPNNWFGWLQARQFYHSRRYTFLDTMLDKFTLAEILYYQLHLAKTEYEIASFLKLKVNKLIKHFKMERELYPNQHKIDPFVLINIEVEAVDMNNKVFTYRREALNAIPSLAATIGLTSRTGHFDIERLSLPDVANLDFIDCDKIISEAKKNSLELKSLDYLLRSAKYTKATKASGFISGAGAGADYRSFGLSFGIDTVANVQIANSDIKLVQIQQKKTEALIDQVVSGIVYQYNESIRDYQTIVGSKGDYSIVYDGIKKSLEVHNKLGEVKTDVHQIDFLFNTLLRMNRLKHNILIYKALLERYKVVNRLQVVMDLLPVTKELERLKKWAEKREEKEKKREEKQQKKEIKKGLKETKKEKKKKSVYNLSLNKNLKK